MNSTIARRRPRGAQRFVLLRLINMLCYLFIPLLITQAVLRHRIPLIVGVVAILLLTGAVTAIRWWLFRRVVPMAVLPVLMTMLLIFATDTGNVTLLDFRQSIMATLTGCLLLGSLLLARPMAFLVCRQLVTLGDQVRRARFDARWEEPAFRRSLRLMTVVWALAAFTKGALAPLIVHLLPYADPKFVENATTGPVTLCLLVWSIWYGRQTVVERTQPT